MNLHKQNDKTIEVYDLRAKDYIEKTPKSYRPNHAPMLKWINFSLDHIPQKGTVLEIGSGNGREALYIKSKGFHIDASDVVEGFVSHLRAIGLGNAFYLNILKDPLPKGKYDLIVANAVLPHFTATDVESTLKKVYSALKPAGLFAFSLKQGKGDEWVNEKFYEKRFIHFWTPEDIKNLCELNGYEVIFLEGNIPGDIPAHTWINITIRKV